MNLYIYLLCLCAVLKICLDHQNVIFIQYLLSIQVERCHFKQGETLTYVRDFGYTQNAGYFFVKKKVNRKRWIFLSKKK